MTSLDQAYDRRWRRIQNPRRVLGGAALVVSGVLAVIVAMLLVGTGGDSTVAKQYAGVAAGLGIPAMLLGVVVVLPASTRERVGVILGTTLAIGGVALFRYAYPGRWTRTTEPLAFETMMLYGLGCAIALWFVFTAIASFRLRNNPQGTVSLEVVRQGETRTVEVSQDRYHEMVSDGGDTEAIIQELEEQ